METSLLHQLRLNLTAIRTEVKADPARRSNGIRLHAGRGSWNGTEEWKWLEEVFGAVAGWLKTDCDGTERLFFLGGDRICYADLVVAGFLTHIETLVSEEEWKGNVMIWDGGRWARFMDAFRTYGTVDAGTALDLQNEKM